MARVLQFSWFKWAKRLPVRGIRIKFRLGAAASRYSASRARWRPQRNTKTFLGKKNKAPSRVPVTASIAWPASVGNNGRAGRQSGSSTDETRTPNLHRAKRSSRMRMEGWRQRRLGRREKPCSTKRQKNQLDSDWPSHGGRFHQLRTVRSQSQWAKCFPARPTDVKGH